MFLVHVTVAFNSTEDLEKLFINIGTQQEKTHFIICVDNSDSHYKEKNKTICTKYNLIQNYTIEYYPLKRNYGSAKGFAIAMTIGYNAGAEYIWLHDQDGYPLPGCLHNIKKYLTAGINILSPKVMAENNKYLYTFHYNYNDYGSLIPMVFTKELIWADVAGTAGLFIKRELMDIIGIYDYKHYFIGNEDFDYCLRAGRKGFKVLIAKDALYYHPNKWGDFSLTKKKNFVTYFGNISSCEIIDRSFSYINYDIKYCKYNFLISFIYSILIVLLKKICFRQIDMLATYKCYISAIINRYFIHNNKVSINPQSYFE
jgi:GT2 family glycosyltransferase